MRLIYKNHYKALFLLGLPIVIGQVGVIVLGFADTFIEPYGPRVNVKR